MVPTRRSQRGTATGRWRWQRAVAVVGWTTLWRWLAGPRCGGGPTMTKKELHKGVLNYSHHTYGVTS
ncbi:MAG: hypothetical protein AAFP83_16170 [Bacteroidota bacterium]